MSSRVSTRFHTILFLLILLSSLTHLPANSQIIRKAGEMIQSAIENARNDTLPDGAPDLTLNAVQAFQDSTRLQNLEKQLQEMRLNEILLRSELDNALKGNYRADSLRQSRQRQRIDSLRASTPGVPVVIEGDTLFTIFAARGGYTAADRADMIRETVRKIGDNRSLKRDSVYMLENDNYIDIMYGDKVILSITETDALWAGLSRQELARRYIRLLDGKIRYLKNENSFWMNVKRAGLFVLVIVFQYLMFKFINYLFRRLQRQIIRRGPQHLHPIVVREYELLNVHRLCRILVYASNILRYGVLLLLLVLTVPMLFAIFPRTENLALRIFSYILDPAIMIGKSIIDYIPNLFIILLIWYCIRYAIKGLRYIKDEIRSEKLRISGFYPDWAEPTFNIVRFLLYAFMIAMIYPYLPGSESGVFQGISVFVGLIVSLGSSTVIANFISGFVITYMRPFHIGDFIKVKDTTGNVIEKTPFVTRLRTIKNEIITIPNSFIMSADTVNYSMSARRYGLIIHTTMTMGYDVPWRKVHRLLIESALATPGVLEHPEPFVLETQLDDNYMCYQINAYITDADRMPDITSGLLQQIQDHFHAAGIELIAPHFYATRDGSESRIPEDFRNRSDLIAKQ